MVLSAEVKQKPVGSFQEMLIKPAIYQLLIGQKDIIKSCLDNWG